MHSISNQHLTIAVRELGAELQSIKSAGIERLWQGDARIWSGRAPILFPIVGALKGAKYEFEGQQYALPRHGLARKATFKRVDATSTALRFELVSNDATREVYPWDFALSVRYELQDKHLHVEYRVINHSDSTMRFTIGSHPAFNLSEPIDHYHIRFSHAEALNHYPLTTEGLLHDTGIPYPLDNQRIMLTETLFDNDALVFKDIESTHISLCDQHRELIRVHNGGAPHLGLWSKPSAPYVCIEPWFGYSDSVSGNGQWMDKPAMTTLRPAEEFFHRWAMEFL
ncbi:MAG: aldose 1-epimerase family protein [Pseudomonadota bacterium]